jgi:hypothetical protein
MVQEIEDLRAFLVAARQHAYAGEGGDASPTVSGARQFEFAGGRWRYHDLSVGAERLAGQEIVYQDESPVWTMVYAGGRWPDAELDTAEIYRFLRSALLAEVEHCRLPGRSLFGEEELRYISTGAGDLAWFEGNEEIRYLGGVVYRLVYSGGWVR